MKQYQVFYSTGGSLFFHASSLRDCMIMGMMVIIKLSIDAKITKIQESASLKTYSVSAEFNFSQI